MDRRFLLDVVVSETSLVFKLLASENQALLIVRNTLFVLDLGFHRLDRVSGLHLEGNCLSRKRPNEDLHRATSQTKDEVDSGLFLDVVVRESASVVQLLAAENEALLGGGDSLLGVELGLDRLDGVRRLDLEGCGIASQCSAEDLHVALDCF